jgi:hypothetical protein
LLVKGEKAGMTVDLRGATFDYHGDVEFGEKADLYSDMIQGNLGESLHFAIGILK